MNKLINYSWLISILFLGLTSTLFSAETEKKPSSPSRTVDEVLKQLTVDEKIALLWGDFESGGVPRLGIPSLMAADGPVGIRLKKPETQAKPDQNKKKGVTADDDGEVTEGAAINATATALPATLSLAATFDVAAAECYGQLIGAEARALGFQVMFGPGLNMMRDPRGGRNYEYMGEDPLLTGLMGASYIRGMQRQGVSATAKHYYANECDRQRHFTSSNLDDRTASEIYALPFELAVREGGVWIIMTGNNLVNGNYITQNPDELDGRLRQRWGFDGVVLTDWRAAYTPLESIRAGTDMTTGLCKYVYGDEDLKKLVADGTVTMAQLDTMAKRVLTLYQRTGLLDGKAAAKPSIDTAAHAATARALASEGMVLLKNENNLLPLTPRSGLTIALAGQGAQWADAGTGSGRVNTPRISPMEGLRAAYPEATITIAKTPDQAAKADLVIFCATMPPSGEGDDPESHDLRPGQSELIHAFAQANPKLLVVVQNGTAANAMPWVDAPQAVLFAWFGGQAVGQAIGDIVSGAVNPSGHLPFTLGRRIDDYPAAALKLWPARLILDKDPGKAGLTKANRRTLNAYAADYKEGVFMGYRWFDQQKIEPLFPFGFGLSYTTFSLTDLKTTDNDQGMGVTCTVANTGKRAGAQVIQVYVAPPKSSVDRPVRELKGFARVELNPGESRAVTVQLRPSALAYYDISGKNWKIEAGEYQIEVGTSSRDLPLNTKVTVTTARTVDRY